MVAFFVSKQARMVAIGPNPPPAALRHRGRFLRYCGHAPEISDAKLATLKASTDLGEGAGQRSLPSASSIPR